MKKLYYLFIVPLLLISCEREEIDTLEEMDYNLCNNAKVILQTCAGIVVQLQNSSAGEKYHQWSSDSTPDSILYNCVLAENLTKTKINNGETISIDYVSTKSIKGLTCDLGGLPYTKISITKVFPKCNLDL